MLQVFYRLAVYVPIPEIDERACRDIVSTNAVQALLQILRKYDFAGNVGTYNGVAEISWGAETFVPTQASSPTKGAVNVPTDVVSARLVTYIPITTPREELDTLIEEMASAHPWEHPVLEVDRVSLWMLKS
jgi:hypothetical protein